MAVISASRRFHKGGADQLDCLVLFSRSAETVAQPHATEAESGHLKIAKLALLQANLLPKGFV